MNVTVSTIRRDHIFDLARQLYHRDALAAIFTGYPMFRLKGEKLPAMLIRSFPWIQTPYMAKCKFGLNNRWLHRGMEWWAHKTLDDYSARNLPECDAFYGFAGCGLKTGMKAKARGSIYLCDRPNSHIRYQNTLLKEEYRRQCVVYEEIEERIMRQEEREYAAADIVIVPSRFAQLSFLEMGFEADKIKCIPYGVDLSRFHPTGTPALDRFDVLFVGSVCLRKGIPYLLEGFARLLHPNKQLTIVGSILPEMHKLLEKYVSNQPIRLMGTCPQPQLKDIMSRSHIMVLPSVEDGFGLVMAEAMACGCPVIATSNTGAPDLYEDGREGFIVPIRDPQAIAERMQQLADDPALQQQLSWAARQRVQALGGWDTYGDAMMSLFAEAIEAKKAERHVATL